MVQTSPLGEEFEDTKGVIRIRKLKDRQHNGHKNNDMHSTDGESKDRATQTPSKDPK